MLILVDDIKFESEEIFFGYIDTMFPDDTISGIESLYNVLTAGEPDIEFIISDFNQIKEENKDFAAKILHKLVDVKTVNKNFKLTMIET